MKIVSGLRALPILLWIALFSALLVYALHEDLTNEGLQRTQAFLVLGPLVYPLFYGCVLFVLYRFASMFQRRGDYIAIGDSSFRFGRTDVPLNDVRDVDVKKNWLGLEQLVVLRNHGADYRLAGYTLSRPITDVATALLAALPTQTPR